MASICSTTTLRCRRTWRGHSRLRFDHDEMTQQELANRVGCTRQTIVLLEHGRYVPSLALAFRIAQTFGLTVDDVFEYVGGTPPQTS